MEENVKAGPSHLDVSCKISKKIYIQWDIKDFKTVAQKLPKGKFLYSKDFSLKFNDTIVTFYMAFFPNGMRDDSDILLCLVNNLCLSESECSLDVNISQKFSLLDKSGEEIEIGDVGEFTLPCNRGIRNFIDHDVLFASKSKLLKNDTLTILCKMKVKYCKELPDEVMISVERPMDLKTMCANHFINNIDIENCVDYLVISDKHSSTILKDACKEFIMDNYNDLTDKCKLELQRHPNLMSQIISSFYAKCRVLD